MFQKMEGPGISLFQGSESLDISNNQEDEENEALEDERRRNDELRDLISNAFDDLTDDDRSFADSSRPLSSNDIEHQGHETKEEPFGSDAESTNEVLYSRDGRFMNPERIQNRPTHMDNIGSSNHNSTVKEAQFFGAGDSNASVHHYKHCARTTPGFREAHSGTYDYDQEYKTEKLSDDDQYLKMGYNSLEQLQVLYEVRLKEIQRLHDEIDMTKKEHKQTEIQQKRKLALMEAEKERAVLSLKQSQNLLVTSKGQIGDMEKQVEDLKKHTQDLEESNYNLTTQLEIAKSSVTDLQNRISFLERINSSKTKELENESYVRLIEDRQRKELSCLQEEVEIIKAKYNKKEAECIDLEKKVKEVTKSLEATLADKTEVINRLARGLEESQARCEQLMSSQMGQENCELRMQLAGEKSEKEALHERITSLQQTIEMLQSDIRNYEAASHLGLLSSENAKESDSILQLGLGGGTHSAVGSFDSKSDVNAKLKEELKRSLIGQRMKREEIRRLQMELEARDLQIQEMQLQESKYLEEAETFKIQTQKLLQHLRNTAANNSVSKQKDVDLENELSVLKEQLKKLQENNETLDYENKRLEKENSSLISDNATLCSKIEEISKVKEKEKQDAIDQFQNEYLKFHDHSLARVRAEKNEPLEKEINALRKQLEEAHREADEAKKAYIAMCDSKEYSSIQAVDGSDLIDNLKKQLQQEKEEFSKFREDHNTLVKQKCEALQKENTELIKKMEERSRAIYEMKVAEEIEKAKKECIRELELHYEKERENLRKEMEKEVLEKQKSLVDAEVAKMKHQLLENNMIRKSSDEKDSELCRECYKLQEELDMKQQQWNQEIDRMKAEAEKDKLEKLRENQREIEERLGQEFREQLKKAEATREHAAKMLKEQLEAEQTAFLQKYEEKLHEYSMKVKSHSTRTVGTSPIEQMYSETDDIITKADLEELLRQKERVMEEKFSNEVAEAERRGRLESESLYSGNLDVFRKFMEAKSSEVDAVRASMTAEKNRLQAALIEARTAATEAAEIKAKQAAADVERKMKDEEIAILKQKVTHLANELETLAKTTVKEKDTMAETIARWANNVQEMKAARKNETRNLVQVYKKYQEIKKTVADYKVYLENKDKHLENEHKQLVESFTVALSMIEERMKDVYTKQDELQAERLATIEVSYDKKTEKMLQKLKQFKSGQQIPS